MRTQGSAPDPVLAGRQPVCHDRPESKRMYAHWMSRVKINSLTLALDILRQIYKMEERRPNLKKLKDCLDNGEHYTGFLAVIKPNSFSESGALIQFSVS
jgi:hypothetical protein